MRKKWEPQMPLMPAEIDHPQAQELEAISRIISSKPIICELVLQDLGSHRCTDNSSGANGMSADQVLRAAIVKTLFGLSYQELAFHIVDSQSIRRFCQIGIADKGYKKSALNNNIKAISDDTWRAIHSEIIGYAGEQKIEKGREVRIDCTVVESNIHPPSDSTLLYDAVRVLARLLNCAKDMLGSKIIFQDHTRRAKKRMLAIQYAKNDKQRKPRYKDLIKVSKKSLGYAHSAKQRLSAVVSPTAIGLRLELETFVQLTEQVIDQAERRVIKGEKVPATEKIVSLFEPHTDVIVKDRRDTYYGHKICLTGGASNLILDCLIAKGNPADTSLTATMLDRQQGLYGRYPLKAALDGGFASKENLKIAKSKKIKDVCFAKKRGLAETDMCRSHYVYKRLRRFRAGIEAGISWLKRSFGLNRCTWKGWRSFKSYVWATVVSANLLTIARKQLA
ncbi:MAG: ISNCY family transposase [Desulfobacterales bacterium]